MKETNKKYVGLGDAERSEIEILLSRNCSIREIAKALKRSPNTISREIKVNSVTNAKTKELEYIAVKAKAKSRLSRRSRRYQSSKINVNPELQDFITSRLAPPYDWSPKEIAGYLSTQQEELPAVSTKTIYNWLRSSRGQAYCQYLYCKRYRVKKRVLKTGRQMIPDRVSIDERPAEVEVRFELGHYEFDSVVSAKPFGRPVSTYALAVVQERTTRLVMAQLVPNLKPEDYANSISGLVNGLKVKTFTTDNGIENKHHHQITRVTGGDIYFTDPYSSWQKGGVENVNKMIRRYFPKGTNFAKITQRQVNEAIRRINNKPRAILGFKSALQCAYEKGLLLEEVSY